MVRSRRVFYTPWIFLLYIAIGLVVAYQYGYITARLLIDVLEALLAVFLWFLPVLGVSLHLS